MLIKKEILARFFAKQGRLKLQKNKPTRTQRDFCRTQLSK